MTDERNGPDPEQVIPPPPPDAGGAPSAFPPVAPLAPPLSGAPALPPYAAGYAPAPPGSGAPPVSDFGRHPATAHPSPAPSSNSNAMGIVLAVVGGIVVLAVVGVAMLIGLLTPAPDEASPPPAATSTPRAEDPGAPSDDPPSDGDPSDGDASGIAERLEAKIDEYKRLRDSGALWDTIPDNEFNRTAVSAFLYLMTDMKVATIWGIDAEQAQEYDERMAMLEERLLAQEPLGDDIKITLDDRIFTYDGETGEGGYTDK
ncbi:hypothetical protein [Microbacterium sp. PMB16]|uniref:hypothetical protein n=1 Tax=Microbacterium sp. PMB16 TaxID=3120157 RepID=UPI003F4CABCD